MCEQAIERGLDVDDFAPRLSFFFNAQIDFFEEIAKYRAARRIWARELRETFGAKNPKSWLMRTHVQTAGVSLTAQQPLNNITRTAIEALAGVLGGTQSLHTNSFDEALALPTEQAVRDRAADAADHRPRDRRGEHDRPARRLLLRRGADRRDGGAPPTPTSPASTSSAGWSRRSSRTSPSARSPTPATSCRARSTPGRRIVVGVNAHTEGDDDKHPILHIDPALERKQIGRVQAVRARRDAGKVQAALGVLKQHAATEDNLMPHLLDCARVHATEGEIVEALQEVFGSYTETPVF